MSSNPNPRKEGRKEERKEGKKEGVIRPEDKAHEY
jgi:hypothetical protein